MRVETIRELINEYNDFIDNEYPILYKHNPKLAEEIDKKKVEEIDKIIENTTKKDIILHLINL